MVCKLCSGDQSQVIYEGSIRAGQVGTLTDMPYQVWRCQQCEVGFLEPLPKVEYDSAAYRESYNESAEVDAYYRAHDPLSRDYLARTGVVDFRGRVVADFGCGGGSFLDFVHGLAAETIAIEPFHGYHAALTAKGHRVYSYAADWLTAGGREAVDVATSFHVLEHVPDPVAYLREIYDLLKPGGTLLLATPNLDDLMVQLEPQAYSPFYFRTVHTWYFNGRSLRCAAQKVGFDDVTISYQQNYDLSNAFSWVKEKRPTGLGRLPFFDARIDQAWRQFLEQSGAADVVWATMRK